jgi:sphinganine-1-phosphate aldolase
MFLARLLRQSSLAKQPPLALTVGNLKDVIFYYLLVKYLLKRWRHLVAHGPVQTVVDGWRWLSLVRRLCVSGHLYAFSDHLMQQVVLLVMRLPSTRAKVEAEIGKARQDIITKLIPQGPNVTRHISLPSQGQSAQWVAEEMERMDAESENTGLWRQGKLSGAVYRMSPSPHYEGASLTPPPDGGDDTETVIVAAFKRYCVSNPLHPDVFPGTVHPHYSWRMSHHHTAVRKMEAEIVAMCLRMQVSLHRPWA